jgi:hypothetical protein
MCKPVAQSGCWIERQPTKANALVFNCHDRTMLKVRFENGQYALEDGVDQLNL